MMDPRQHLYGVIANAFNFCERNFKGEYKIIVMNYVMWRCIKIHNAVWKDNLPERQYAVMGN